MILTGTSLFMDQKSGLLLIFCLDGGKLWRNITVRHCSSRRICLGYVLYAYSEVAKAIARIIALALDLEVDYFDQQETLEKPIATLRLLHYEGRISDPAEGIFGAGAHSDFGFITLLATDDNHGLQICKDKDAKPQQWEFVAPLRGAFIVNLADH